MVTVVFGVPHTNWSQLNNHFMKSYDFSNITVRPFPTVSDLNNPWIIGGIQVIINVSGHDYTDEVKKILSDKGIDSFWFPLVEEGPDMGINNIIKAVKVLQQCDAQEKKVLLHCTCGNNRSRTVAEFFYFLKTGEQFKDEYKGYQNHLIYNIAEGHLPSAELMANMNQISY